MSSPSKAVESKSNLEWVAFYLKEVKSAADQLANEINGIEEKSIRNNHDVISELQKDGPESALVKARVATELTDAMSYTLKKLSSLSQTMRAVIYSDPNSGNRNNANLPSQSSVGRSAGTRKSCPPSMFNSLKRLSDSRSDDVAENTKNVPAMLSKNNDSDSPPTSSREQKRFSFEEMKGASFYGRKTKLIEKPVPKNEPDLSAFLAKKPVPSTSTSSQAQSSSQQKNVSQTKSDNHFAQATQNAKTKQGPKILKKEEPFINKFRCPPGVTLDAREWPKWDKEDQFYSEILNRNPANYDYYVPSGNLPIGSSFSAIRRAPPQQKKTSRQPKSKRNKVVNGYNTMFF